MAVFILMLTRNDETVANAAELLKRAISTGVQHIGFKDVGVPRSEMVALVDQIHASGLTAHLEIVSLDEQAERRSMDVGLELGVDYLIGGTRWRELGSLLVDSPVRYFPYAGEVTGHPAVLDGSINAIADEIREMGAAIQGVNLLAYRHVRLRGSEIIEALNEQVSKPVIVAGSIDSLQRVRVVAAAGVWGFTIGAAVLDGGLVPGQGFESQIRAAIEAAAETTLVRPSAGHVDKEYR